MIKGYSNEFFTHQLCYFINFVRTTTDMKILLEVNNNKAAFILDMLRQYSFVKAKPVVSAKTKLKEDIKEAVE
jgi:hypothetical protein